MKILYITIIVLIFSTSILYGQSDTTELGGNYSSIYNPYTNSFNSSYDYSNKYDFDGDNINDSLLLIGQGGVHAYYFLRIVLSSDSIQRNFPTVQIDFPYEMTSEEFEQETIKDFIQIGIYDFNNDGFLEIYLHFNNDFSMIPKEWKAQGIQSKRVILDFKNNNLNCKDY